MNDDDRDTSNGRQLDPTCRELDIPRDSSPTRNTLIGQLAVLDSCLAAQRQYTSLEKG